MDGSAILTATMSRPSVPDRFGNLWQYHSRSDRHSKVASWALLFDFLNTSSLARQHIIDGKITLDVNHKMRDARTNRTKNLDIVIAKPTGAVSTQFKPTFADYAVKWNLHLSAEQLRKLDALPAFSEGQAGSVLVALEAKACMTAHIKALPRLYDELNSSHQTVHGENPGALAVGIALVNASSSFISPDLNKFDLHATHAVVSEHKQPLWASRAVAKIREIAQREKPPVGDGFDSLGVVVLDARNDGSPIREIAGDPAPAIDDPLHYRQLVLRLTRFYESEYAAL